MKNYFQSILIFLFSFCCFPALADIHFKNSSIKVSSGMGKAAAVFMTIKNDSDVSDRLMSVTTTSAKKAMLHDTVVSSNGVVKMKHIMMGLKFGVGEEIILKSGGKHIMLMGLTEKLQKGNLVKLVLKFKNAGELETTVVVNDNN
jgi:copper(I)-binding protein